MGQILTQWKNDNAEAKAKYKLEIYRVDYEVQNLTADTITDGKGKYYLAGYKMKYVHLSENEEAEMPIRGSIRLVCYPHHFGF